MARIGIVAEFNPFHTGHRYIIDYAKNKLQADYVIIAMGHEFTQRGGVAIIDRYSRAKCAIDAGADLVVGMPVIASCASAEVFAECGICLLHACGCEKIVCGYEGADSTPDHPTTDQVSGYFSDTSIIKEIANVLISEPEEYRRVLKKELASGNNFPAARETALIEYFSSYAVSIKKNVACNNDNSKSFLRDKIFRLVSNPNNILAIEYQKAILKHGFDIDLIPVKRQGTAYNDITNDGEYVSASYIRHAIDSGNFPAIKKHLTPCSYQVLKNSYEKKLLLTDDDLSLSMHLTLLEHSNSMHNNNYLSQDTYNTKSDHSSDKLHQFSQFLDVSNDLSDRITKLLPQYTTFENFTELVKNRSLTASRIRRSLMHILLGITNDDLESLRTTDFVPYLWILSASKNGFSMLCDIKAASHVPLFMSINELKDKKKDGSLFHLDLKATELVRALRINKSGILIPNEWQRKIIPMDRGNAPLHSDKISSHNHL